MTDTGNFKQVSPQQDISYRIQMLRVARRLFPRLLMSRCVSSIDRQMRLYRLRRLGLLSDRQLNDAGIDLTLAGRGKAAAACLDPNLEGLR
jgi:hypothetical protein